MHRLALPHKDVAAAIETVRASSSPPSSWRSSSCCCPRGGAIRSDEVRLATWDEIDVADRVWSISAMRMKAKREHRAPLCGRALEIFDAARTRGDGNLLVLPMRSGKALSPSTLPKMPAPPDFGRGARLPFVVPGLEAEESGQPAGGHRGGAGLRGHPRPRLSSPWKKSVR